MDYPVLIPGARFQEAKPEETEDEEIEASRGGHFEDWKAIEKARSVDCEWWESSSQIAVDLLTTVLYLPTWNSSVAEEWVKFDLRLSIRL